MNPRFNKVSLVYIEPRIAGGWLAACCRQTRRPIKKPVALATPHPSARQIEDRRGVEAYHVHGGHSPV
jgi:hypothetical protein